MSEDLGSAGLLMVIATAAFLLPLIASTVGAPAVVLEIGFGIVVGPAILNLVEPSEFLDLLAELGFFLLMFLSGFEIDFRKLQKRGRGEIVVALGMFASTLALAALFARLLGYGNFMTFVLATTSVGLVVPTLRNTRREATNMGQAILVSAILADFLTLLGVTIFALIKEQGMGADLLNIPLLFIAIGGLLMAMRRAAWWFPERFERLFSEHDPEELGIRASLALMLVLVGLSAALSVEPILGAFMAGSVFALVFPHRGRLEHKLTGFSYGFLIPIFFINVGVGFEVQALLEPEILRAAVALIVVAVVVKLVPALLLTLRGLSLKEAVAAGVLLSARLSLIIAVAELGVQLGVIGPKIESAIITLALITTTVAPTVFKRLMPAATPTSQARW